MDQSEEGGLQQSLSKGKLLDYQLHRYRVTVWSKKCKGAFWVLQEKERLLHIMKKYDQLNLFLAKLMNTCVFMFVFNSNRYHGRN